MSPYTAELARHLLTGETVRAEIARQRAGLLRARADGEAQITEVHAKARAVNGLLRRREPQVDRLTERFGQLSISEISEYTARLSPEGWLESDGRGGWAIQRGLEILLDENIASVETNLIEYRDRPFGGSFLRAATETYMKVAATIEALHRMRLQLADELRQTEADIAEQLRLSRAEAEEALAPVLATMHLSFAQLPAPFLPWDSPAWQNWSEPVAGALVCHVHGGHLHTLPDDALGHDADFGAGVDTPLLMPMRRNIEFVYNEAGRESAVGLTRSLLLRHVAAGVPGELQLTFFDPVGLGQSAGELLDLAEYDPALIGGKVWSAATDLDARLAELTAHIELVIQKYLRSTYETIEDFNREAGEIAEPFRLLVVYDFPRGFTQEAVTRLNSVVQNGPRCGVYTLVLRNADVAMPFGVDAAALSADSWRINLAGRFVDDYEGYQFYSEYLPDHRPPPQHLSKRIVETVGRKVIARTEGAITFEKVFGLFSDLARRGIRPELSGVPATTVADNEATWWSGDSTPGLYAPIGQKGARDAAILGFDSGDSSGALLVGRPGSGKSTLLHAYIAGLTTLYGPDQLELHLIDFKAGVEFACYATQGLPHARTVAIESDREFGLSVLRSLVDELTRRGELLRATGGRHTGLQALREATGDRLPRVLLVFDEFQVLFSRNDKVGLAASDLLETLIRQGRGFGVHLLLGSQSLSGLDALGAHVPQLLPTRILLAATELDQHRVLGDRNDAGQYLTSHGQGILNSASGAVEANERFKGALLDEGERLARLRALRAKADREGFPRRPSVFEGNARISLDAVDPAGFCTEMATTGAAPVRLRVGAPMTAAGASDIVLRREAGAHVLAIVRDGEPDGTEPSNGPAYALLTSAVASAAQGPARIDVIDFLSVDDGLDATLEPLLDSGRITLRRRRAFAQLAKETVVELRERIESDDSGARARLIFLFGVHRARELDTDFSSLDADTELSDVLEEIFRDGPEVGIHVWLWADTVGGAARRLSTRMIRECGWRIAGQMSGDDSHSLVGNDAGADLRESQFLLSNDDRGLTSRVTGYTVPTPRWLRAVVQPERSAHA